MAVKKAKIKEIETQKVEEPKKYLECPFCHSKQYRILSKDITDSWCGKCGRRFHVVWKGVPEV